MFIYLGKKYIAKLSCHLENNEQQQQQKSRDNWQAGNQSSMN